MKLANKNSLNRLFNIDQLRDNCIIRLTYLHAGTDKMFVGINDEFGFFFNEMYLRIRPFIFVVNQNLKISYRDLLSFLCGMPGKLEDSAAGMQEKQLWWNRSRQPPTQLPSEIINYEGSKEVIHIIV